MKGVKNIMRKFDITLIICLIPALLGILLYLRCLKYGGHTGDIQQVLRSASYICISLSCIGYSIIKTIEKK